MKKLSKVLASALMLTVLATNGVPVFAEDIAVTGSTATGQSTSSFVVTPEMLGGDLVVSIPSELTLTYNQDNSEFECADYVSAGGHIALNQYLQVGTPLNVTFKNTLDDSVTVDGTVNFGMDYDANGKVEWTPAELLSGVTTPKKKSLYANVPNSNIDYIGTYSAIVTYDISVVTN